MDVSFLRKMFCFIVVYVTIGTAGLILPLYQASNSPSSLTNVSVNVSDPPAMELCTSSLIWTGNTGYDHEFTDNCFQAWRVFLGTDLVRYKGGEFEFLQQGVTPSHPGVPKMATPRRYIKSGSTAQFDDEIMPLTSR